MVFVNNYFNSESWCNAQILVRTEVIEHDNWMGSEKLIEIENQVYV